MNLSKVWVLMALFSPFLSSCNNQKVMGAQAEELESDSSAQVENGDSLLTEVEKSAPPKKAFTSFTVNSKNITIPGLKDFKPILDMLGAEG